MKPTFVVAAIVLAVTGLVSSPRAAAQGSTHAELLVALFSDWRAFQRPKLVDGVPLHGGGDGCPAARASRVSAAPCRHQDCRLAREPARALAHPAGRDERAGLRPSRHSPVGEQSGLLRQDVPRSESDQPARKGHFAYGAIELWSYQFPLNAESASRLGVALRGIPMATSQSRSPEQRPSRRRANHERRYDESPHHGAEPVAAFLPRRAMRLLGLA
jgi:hypothetical protein